MNLRFYNVHNLVVVALVILGSGVSPGLCGDSQNLKSRIPTDQLEAAKKLQSTIQITKESLEEGKALYEGKAFCSACHGRDGTGLQKNVRSPLTSGPSPTNFTDAGWQAARSDGEIFWIIKHGSHGTDMAPFLPFYLAEEQAWRIVAYIRSFGKT